MTEALTMTHWGWLVLGLGLLMLELVASFLFFLWLGVSALVTAGLLYLHPGMGWQAQLLLFSTLSIVSILVSRRYVSRRPIRSEQPNLNLRAQQYVGRVFTLVEPISNGYGKITVDDTQWRVSGPPLEAGTSVRVVSYNGSVLVVEEHFSA